MIYFLAEQYCFLPIVYNSSLEDDLVPKTSSSNDSKVVVAVNADEDNYHFSISKKVVYDSISTLGTTVKTGLSVLAPPIVGGGVGGGAAGVFVAERVN